MSEKNPFKSEFIYNEFTAGQNFRQLENLPDKVIRIYDSREKPDIEKANKAKRLFMEFSQKYGVLIPSINYVIGKNECGDKDVLYTVADKIDGKNIGKLIYAA